MVTVTVGLSSRRGTLAVQGLALAATRVVHAVRCGFWLQFISKFFFFHSQTIHLVPDNLFQISCPPALLISRFLPFFNCF